MLKTLPNRGVDISVQPNSTPLQCYLEVVGHMKSYHKNCGMYGEGGVQVSHAHNYMITYKASYYVRVVFEQS